MRIPRRKRATPAPPSAGGPLDVDVSGTAYGAVVTIAGELDLATVPKVREAFGSEALTHAEAVVVDLAEVGFMDSTGLSALLAFADELGARRRRRGAAAAVPDPRRGGGRDQLSRAARALR